MINIEDFLIEAKKQTYANSSAERILNTRLNSKDYEYQKDNMIYHDTYFGGTRFIGEEVVYIDNQTYWAMNYFGVTLDENGLINNYDEIIQQKMNEWLAEQNAIQAREIHIGSRLIKTI